ncbi:hypothetical protein M0805_000740 [Coniferiporia weirii]|nr:hypothetical protein M0805_000740 [Coniferiporia weirii]
MLDVVLLVACIAIALGSVAYFFFWNRILGLFLSFLVRIALWTQSSSSVWVDLGSAHLSIIAGRILLRDVRYHSSNQTFRIVKCQLNWRWWIRNVAEEEDLADASSNGDESISNRRHPKCRIHVSVEGFEWFMYNRTASFDNILSQLAPDNPEIAGLQTKSRESNAYSLNSSVVDRDQILSRTALYSTTALRALSAIRFPSFLRRLVGRIKHQLPDLDPKSLLPLSFEATKGAITMGNHTTQNLFMAQFVQASGTYGIVQSRSKLDVHKQLLRIDFKEASINCVENPDFWTNGQNIGRCVHECFTKADHATVRLSYADFKRLWVRCRAYFPYFKSRSNRYRKPNKDKEQKKGERIRKAHEEASHVGADFTTLEYAVDRRLLETPLLELTYYADVAGFVPEKPVVNNNPAGQTSVTTARDIEHMDIGNGDLPPEWGIELVVQGGAIHYGPWADRQRAQLQRVFFPQTFQNATSMGRLAPGDQRHCTCLKLFFEFRGVTTIHLPFREASKNWQWDGLVDVPRNSKQREAASMQLRVGDKSSVKYLVPMIATTQGYTAELELFMNNISITSSLNDIRLLEADSCSISSYLPSPLSWDSERSWDFDVELNRPILYLIRDHINMLADLGKDWSSGPPSDFNTFVPITYSLGLTFYEYELNLYANDHNIIDRPLEKKENVLVTFKADMLKSGVYIPMNKYRPLSTTISFSVDTPNVDLSLTLPRWNTHALTTPSAKYVTDVGRVLAFGLSGTYTYHAEVRGDCVDQLKLDIKIPSPALKLFGWIIRHVMVLRENYLGGFTQYSTTREYLGKYEKGVPVGDPLGLKYRPGKNNVFHVDLALTVQNGSVAIPASLLGFERRQTPETVEAHGVDMGRCAFIAVPGLQLQLRLHDYLMDFSFNVDPFFVSVEDSCPDRLLLSHKFVPSKRQVSISGLEITANRLFGPQPHATAYVCIWNIHVGNIKGFVTTMEGQVLSLVGKAFTHGFSDPFNAPDSEFMGIADHDATFLKVVVDRIDAIWETHPAAIRLYLSEGLQLMYNNIARTHCRKATSISIPNAEVQMLLAPNASKRWLEAGRIRSSISVDLYRAPEGWRLDAEKQKRFLELQDDPTHRFASMTRPGDSLDWSRWRNTLFLQNVSPPRLASRSSGKKQAQRSGGLASPSYDLSQGDFADSESDEGQIISEMDRDERLANSRPSSSAIPPDEVEDGRSTSPFDESDETGSNDSNRSWSDYFEFGEDRTGLDPRAHYWTFCRKFQLQHASKEFHCQSTFESRDKPAVLQQPRFRTHNETYPPQSIFSPYGSNAMAQTQLSASDNVDRSYTCLDVRDSVIFLTPLAAMALGEILMHHSANLASPELQLDTLILEWMSSPPRKSISVFDVNLRRSQLCIVQEVPDLMNVPSSFQSPSTANSGTQAIVVTDVTLESAHFFISAPSDDEDLAPRGRFTFHNVTGSVGTLFSTPILDRQRIRLPSAAIEFYFDEISGAFAKSKLDISIGTLESHLHRTVPEVALAAGGALLSLLKDVLSAKRSYSRITKLRKRHLTYSILNHTNEVISKDLLSAVQPTFFVQKGRPQRLRQDNSWALLFHLRHSLAEISEDKYGVLARDLNEVPKEVEISHWLQSRPWATEEGVLDMNVIKTLFDQPVKESVDPLKRNDNQPTISVGFRISSLRVMFDTGDALPQSSVTVNGVDFRADLLTRRLIFDAHTMSPYSSTIRSFSLDSKYVGYGSVSAVLALTIDSMQTTIYPSIITFLQNAVHVWRLLRPPSSTLGKGQQQNFVTNSILGDFFDNRVFVCDTRIIIRYMLIEAAAENVVFEVSARDFLSCSVAHFSKTLTTPAISDISVNHTMRFGEFIVRARTRIIGEENYREKDILAGVTVAGGLSCILFQNHTSQGATVRSTFHVDSVKFSVPRSAIRLYHFFEQWRQDYLMGIEAMMQSLFAEIRQTSKRPPAQTLTGRANSILVDFNISVSTIAVVLQVMHGTWLTWSAHGIVAYTKNKLRSKDIVRILGLQITSQTIKIMSTVHSGTDIAPQRSSNIVLGLPSLSASGAFSDEEDNLLVSVGYLRVTVKPSHWDALLSVQQKFGQDFNDLLLIVGETRRKRVSPTSPKVLPSQKKSKPYNVIGKFEGFTIGLEGPSSTQFLFLECEDIDASVSNTQPLQYQFTLSDLALYLSPKPLDRGIVDSSRNQLPVLISVDLQVTSYRPSPPENPQPRLLVDVSKFHAVLQAHMMGDIGDFIDHLQAEMLLRKEQRALELDGFKEKAKKVMNTFNVNPRASSLARQGAFLSDRTIKVSMSNLGVALPLGLVRRQEDRTTLGEDSATKAFLLSIKSLVFQTQQGESGQALMKGFCFQFIDRFNASIPEDFSADRHHTLNQMIYPEMTAKVRSETSSSARHVFVSAKISGFDLDLDPLITAYSFSLVDAYRQGKQRVDRLTAGIPRNPPHLDATTPISGPDDMYENRRSAIATSSVQASLKFMSGTVRMHPTSKDASAFSSISPDWRGKKYHILDSDAEIFSLPELTVWCEYHAGFGKREPTSQEYRLSYPLLVFKSTVHSSSNILRPSLLPFLTEVVHNIEERMKKVSHGTLRPQPSVAHSLSTLAADELFPSVTGSPHPAPSTLRLIFSLRIDQSRLELTCKPDVNVVAGLHWESGGFVFSMSPGSRGASVSASIGGLTAGLKHGFLSEDSAHIDARNLNFSVNFTKTELPSGHLVNSVSVVIDTEFSGSIRFSRLQDFLCFKAVWLDHIPVFSGDDTDSAGSPSKSSLITTFDQPPKQGFDTAIVVRVRQILLEADLGQSISVVTFELQSALIRTRLTSDFSEISVSVARVDVQARGNLSGHLRMPDFLFRTVRRRRGIHSEEQPLSQMLELHLTTGTLDIQVQSDWLWLLQYRAEPLEAVIYDDWTAVSSPTSIRDRQLQLFFTVSGTKVHAMMTIMAIPKLMMYAGKLRANLEVQREGASRESSAFRSTRLPRPDNALSEVANAMFQSARTKLKEAETFSYVIGQHMRLKLDELVFVVLPRSQGDNELARFIGQDVMAQLERTVQQDSLPVHRNLRLSLSRMSISQLIKQGFDPRLPGQEFDVLTSSRRNLAATENIIFSLPAMDMCMITDEEVLEGSRMLPYDFISNFVRLGGQKGTENINISFNISLYSWLTVLRKTFTRELKRAQDIIEWRAGNTSPLSVNSARFASPDVTTSPFSFGIDQTQSPIESRPSSRSSSRPSSPARARVVEPITIAAPSKGSTSKAPALTSKFSPSDVASNAERGVDLPPLTRTTSASEKGADKPDVPLKKPSELVYTARSRKIERLTVRQLGEATPDVMHPFFTRKAGFNLEESLPQYVHEYATLPIEEIMKVLVKLYSKQLN